MGARNTVGPLEEVVERRLVARLAEGDRQARRRLIEGYIGLVAAVARRYACRWHVPVEDLMQEGSLALVQAIDHYNPNRGMKLSTYVMWWVKQAIRRAAMAQASLVRVPEQVWQRAGELSRTEQSLRSRLKRETRDCDLAGTLGWAEEELEEVRCALHPVVSLQEPVGEEESEMEDLLPDSGAEDPSEVAAHSDARRRLSEALADLPARERVVLSRRAGFEGEPSPLSAVGKELGVSRERARQLEGKALAELRDRREELGLTGLAA